MESTCAEFQIVVYTWSESWFGWLLLCLNGHIMCVMKFEEKGLTLTHLCRSPDYRHYSSRWWVERMSTTRKSKRGTTGAKSMRKISARSSSSVSHHTSCIGYLLDLMTKVTLLELSSLQWVIPMVNSGSLQDGASCAEKGEKMCIPLQMKLLKLSV